MTCKECGQVVKLTRTMNKCHSNTELSSHEETRCQFNGGTGAIKLGIDVHQDFYVVVEQVGGSNPKPPQRFRKQAFLHWAAKLKSQATELYAVYEACGFGFSLQRKLSALSIKCYVVCPQKLDEQNRRVKTDGLDAKALCLKLDRFVQGNRDALAIVRVPSEEEEQARAIHRQREQLAPDRQLNRPLPGRVQQRQHPLTKLRNQARQPEAARRSGRVGLASGALPAQLPPAAQVAADPGQRRTGHWSRAQKSDRSRS